MSLFHLGLILYSGVGSYLNTNPILLPLLTNADAPFLDATGRVMPLANFCHIGGMFLCVRVLALISFLTACYPHLVSVQNIPQIIPVDSSSTFL